jgi:hypothetical protein
MGLLGGFVSNCPPRTAESGQDRSNGADHRINSLIGLERVGHTHWSSPNLGAPLSVAVVFFANEPPPPFASRFKRPRVFLF